MKLFKLRWIRRLGIAVAILTLLVSIVAWRWFSFRDFAPWKILRRVDEIENAGVNEQNVQELASYLTMLGRDDEVRQTDLSPGFRNPPLTIDHSKLQLDFLPWRIALTRIAKENQIVMIMEDHFASKDRAMIGQMLPVFRDAGFTHYAAEAIVESGAALSKRGHPVTKTGFYTCDPQFGNTLRTAIRLNLKIFGYDYRPFSHEIREAFSANQIAKVFKTHPDAKVIVHAGYSHVLKRNTKTGQQWLAALLWEETSIEPYTIWQWSSRRDALEYHVVSEAISQLGDFDEPVLLLTPNTNSGLRNVPDVDAILVHPRDQSIAPAKRTVLFPEGKKKISGKWQSTKWPVVIAARQRNEPPSAISLDQVMLRQNENEFVLWIPKDAEYDVLVYDQYGILAAKSFHQDGKEIVQLEK